MKLNSISALNVLPVTRFQVDNLSDIVVVAGPNGVGKTRLINSFITFLRAPAPKSGIAMQLEATCDEEREDWGSAHIDTSNPQDVKNLSKTFQRTRNRRNWKSSIINFESDRTIQKIKPYAFSWDITDPYEEAIGWDYTFNTMSNRYSDTVHAMFRLIEYQKRNIANKAVQLRREGKESMQLAFSDPMAPYKEAFNQLLAPKELIDPNPRDQVLKYIVGDQEFAFSSLSSGEREVVNIAFDFLLRSPSDCIVFFDEPELHLHPELSFRLLRTLQTIGTNNQFIFTTHSPDIISSALEHSVVLLSPATTNTEGDSVNQAVLVKEDDETNQAIRLLGHSIGIISLGKKLVLVEGTQASLDRQTYGSIIKNSFPGLVLVPSEGKELIKSFHAVSQKVLSRTLWGVEFFMLCDGDTSPEIGNIDNENLPSGKLRTLGRYHLENYFLDENVWKMVFSEMESEESWLRSPEQIREKLLSLARTVTSYAVALHVAANIRRRVGNVSVMPSGCDNKSQNELVDLFLQKSSEESVRISTVLTESELRNEVSKYYTEVEESLSNCGDAWKRLIPGRPILQKFVNAANLNLPRAKKLYIAKASRAASDPFLEIREIFRGFSNYTPNCASPTATYCEPIMPPCD